MFKHNYQGGAGVEVFSAQGKDPVAKWKLCGSQSAIRKEYDKEVKGFVYCLEGSGKIVKMQMPENGKMSLGLLQRFLAIQVYIPQGKDFSMDLVITDAGHLKRRLCLSTVHKELSATLWHAKLPLAGVKRNIWTMLFVDLVSFTGELFKAAEFLSLDGITLFASCKVRRIFTMKTEPTVLTNDDESSLNSAGTSSISPPPTPAEPLPGSTQPASSPDPQVRSCWESNDDEPELRLTLQEEVFTFASPPHSPKGGQGRGERKTEMRGDQVQSPNGTRGEAQPEDDFIGSESDEPGDRGDWHSNPANSLQLRGGDDAELQMLASLQREREEEDERKASGLSASQIHQCNVSMSLSSEDTSTWTHTSVVCTRFDFSYFHPRQHCAHVRLPSVMTTTLTLSFPSGIISLTAADPHACSFPFQAPHPRLRQSTNAPLFLVCFLHYKRLWRWERINWALTPLKDTLAE
uniref:CFAP20 domain containing n=1 Tax=Hippocampus comes TaxID=109280 RepID=A0A3Q2YMR0_HIPCM